MKKSSLSLMFVFGLVLLMGCGGMMMLKKGMADKPKTVVVIQARVQDETMNNEQMNGSDFKAVANEAVKAIKSEYTGIDVSVYDKDLPTTSMGMVDFKAVGSTVCYINLTFRKSEKFGFEFSVAPIIQFIKNGEYLHGGKSLKFMSVKPSDKETAALKKNGFKEYKSFIKKKFAKDLGPVVSEGIKEYLKEAKSAKE